MNSTRVSSSSFRREKLRKKRTGMKNMFQKCDHYEKYVSCGNFPTLFVDLKTTQWKKYRSPEV